MRKSVKLLLWGLLAPPALVAVLLIGVFVALQFTALPLVSFTREAAGGTVVIESPSLHWSQTHSAMQVKMVRLHYKDAAGLDLTLHDVTLVNDSVAIWLNGTLALSIAHIGRAELRTHNTPPPLALAPLVQRLMQQGGSFLRYIDELAIDNIALIAATGEAPAKPSSFSLRREGNSLTMRGDVAYFNTSTSALAPKEAWLTLAGQITALNGGEIELGLTDVYAADLSALGGVFAPLRYVDAPMNVAAVLRIGDDFRPTTGAIDISIVQGKVNVATPFYKRALDLSEVRLLVHANFHDATLTWHKGRAEIGKSHFTTGGDFAYTLKDGALDGISGTITDSQAYIDNAALFPAPVDARNIKAQLSYAAPSHKKGAMISLTNFTSQNKAGAPLISLDASYNIATTALTLDMDIGAMSTSEALSHWVVPLAPNARKWVIGRISKGRMTSANLIMNMPLNAIANKPRRQPLPEDGVHFTLMGEDISLRFLDNVPAIEGAQGRIDIHGKTLQVKTSGGYVRAPNQKRVEVQDITMTMADYRDPKRFARFDFGASGAITDILHLVDLPPINALPEIDFAFTRIGGTAETRTQLYLPLTNTIKRDEIRFAVQATSTDATIDGTINDYTLSAIEALVDIDNKALHMRGNGKANGVAVMFDWQQPLTNAAASRMAVSAPLRRADIIALNQPELAASIDGTAQAQIMLEGALTNLKRYRFTADLQAVAFSPRPLAYTKAKGVAGTFTTTIDVAKGAWRTLQFTYIDANTPRFGGTFAFNPSNDNRILTNIALPAFTLGKTKNLLVSLDIEDTHRFLTIGGDTIHIAPIFNTDAEVRAELGNVGLVEYLGDLFSLQIMTPQLMANGEILQGARIVLHRKQGIYEGGTVRGSFPDGAHLLANLNRATPETRAYTIQTENSGALTRFIGLSKSLYGGSLASQGTLFDDPKAENILIGGATLIDFKVRDLPVLARILALPSLQGPRDMVGGEGISFNSGSVTYRLQDDILRLRDGRIGGGSIGLTISGDYDTSTDAIHMGGTVVPAYQANKLLGRIPLLGTLLTGRKGEGLFGFTYRIGGKVSVPSVAINPASLLTPGIVRRLFEFDIGLPDKNAIPEALDPREEYDD